MRAKARVARRVALGALGGLVVWALLGVPFLVLPQTGPLPRHADVVLVLGPPIPERVATAERLLDDGTVSAALVSVPYDRVPQQLEALCARTDVVCADPDPRTTRGEARLLRRYAAQRGWSSAVVVSMTAHLTRARTIVGRCFSGPITMVASGEPPSHGWVYQYLYQTAATVKSWILA
ncbi:YdcF family protein, partial [uncultured Amnibacterium sp.]|uniref:YdcF family protein n=1 Tax=uncultured Amnibacterium sp. TaxID=1631851 RepID=UPI0035CB70E7